MNTWIRRGMQVGLMSAGLVLAGAAAAQAADLVSVGNQGTGNGTQVFAPVQAPVNTCGNATTTSGNAIAGCEGGAEAVIGDDDDHDHHHHWKPGKHTTGKRVRSGSWAHLGDDGPTLTSIGNQGTGNGTQTFTPVQTPTNTCGIATSAGGNAIAGCRGGAEASIKRAPVRKSADLTSIGNQGTDNGTQTFTPVQTPTNTCGIATTVSGNAIAGCRGGAEALIKRAPVRKASLVSIGNQGTGNGIQTFAPVQTATNTCGTATSGGGNAIAGCKGGAKTVIKRAPVRKTSLVSVDNQGTGNGTQTFTPVQTATNTCGNATSDTGNAIAGCEGGAETVIGDDEHHHGKHHGKPAGEGAMGPMDAVEAMVAGQGAGGR